MSTDWNKHFREQVINKGNYEDYEETLLVELFDMLRIQLTERDEERELLNDVEGITAYAYVLKDYLTPEHITFLNKIIEDISKEECAHESK